MQATRQSPLPLLLLLLLWPALSLGREHGFVYCPAYPCLCEPHSGQLVINCRQLYLTELPKFLAFDGRIKELSLRKNSIRSLPAHAFKGLNVRVIDLTENVVTDVHEDAFAGLEESLEELHVQFYAMKGLPVKSLKKLRSLRKLRVVGCHVPVLRAAMLAGLEQLTELHLVACRIGHIDSNALATLRSLTHLDLSSNQLRYQHLKELSRLYQLKELVLSGNQIHVLGGSAFDHLLHLKRLDLSGNGLEHINKEAFKTQDFSLEKLSLDRNSLKDNSLLALWNLRSLRDLNLAANDLNSLGDNTFVNLESLMELDLRDNRIEGIQTDALRGTEKYLKVLKLSGNPLQRLGAGLFEQHGALQSLGLGDTRLGGQLSPAVFKGLEMSLEELQLERSNLTTADLGSLAALGSLRVLGLRSNGLSHVPPRAFLGNPYLRHVDLANNSLTFMADEALEGVERSLQSLDLEDNRLGTLTKCTFQGCHNLAALRLRGNPLQCDCRLGWLLNWVKATVSEAEQPSLQWRCAGPPELSNRGFFKLSLTDLRCSDTMMVHGSKCNWTTENAGEVVVPYNANAVPSPMLPVDFMGTTVTLNLLPTGTFISASWNSTSKHDIGGYRLVVRRTNDSEEIHDVTVFHTVTRYLFKGLEPGLEYDVCVTVLSTEDVPLGRDCATVSTDAQMAGQHATSEQSSRSFMTLLWSYTAGCLAAAVVVAVAVVMIRKMKTKKGAKGFHPGYSAWGSMMFSSPPSSKAPNCYFNTSSCSSCDEASNASTLERKSVNDTVGSQSAMSTFRRNLPANYLVTTDAVHDDFYFHF